MTNKQNYIDANKGINNLDPIEAMKQWLSTPEGQEEYEQWLGEQYDQ